MGLCPAPLLPPDRSSSPGKALIHWYFLFPSTSRILHALDDYFPGPSPVPAPVVRLLCGGTALCLPTFPAALSLFTFVVFAARGVVLFIV